MKVFTVGLDDKEKAQKSDAEKGDLPKMDPTPAMPVPAPIIVPRAPPAKRFGCGVLSWIVAAFFIVLLCLTISEIIYNRQRDQAFLRLKWAELRQRMLGFELLSHAQQQQQQQALAQQQQQMHSLQPVNELPAFPRRHDNVQDAEVTTTTTTTTPAAPKEEETPKDSDEEVSTRFDLLRMILNKMREHAEQMGLTGDMQVHVIEVKPIPTEQMSQQAIDDGFGEVAMPPPFGPWKQAEEENDINNRPGWQFGPGHLRPSPWKPVGFNRFDGRDNDIFEPLQDSAQEEENPQMRITHHFDKDSQMPQRVVTEVFGDNPEIIGHILGQKNAQAQLQFQQQQQQQDLFMQQQQPQPLPQQPLPQWAQPWAHPFPFHQMPHPHPWFMPPQPQPQPMPQPQPQPQFWEQRVEQPVPLPPQPQPQPQPQQPVVLFFNQGVPQGVPQPPQPQFHQQLPAPAPQFQPTIGQQNQFPFPVQNQAPIFPQPFVPDVNNNVNAFNDANIAPKPWYMSGDDQKWQQTWENNPIKIEFNPHPAAAAPWVENTAVVADQHPALPPASAPEPPHIGHDSEGIDNFPREEKFNVPIDISADAEPKTVETSAETTNENNAVSEEVANHAVDTSAVNPPWQHAQPEAAEEPMPASVPVVSEPSVGPAEERDFLPLRDSGEVMGHPHEDAPPQDVVVAQDDFPKKIDSPFFQVDDPQSFMNFRQ